MMERIRAGLWHLRQFIRPAKRKRAGQPIKGNIQNVIVVKPQNRMFSQAMFILNDDYVRQSSLSSQELLRQAREAAGEYVGFMQPQQVTGAWLKVLLIVFASAIFLFAAYYFVFVF